MDSVIAHQPNAFELFGYDLLIDANRDVWLLEINASPMMHLDFSVDEHVKPQLIADTIEVVNPLAFNMEALQVCVCRTGLADSPFDHDSWTVWGDMYLL